MTSTAMDYYDLFCILAEEEKLKVRFNHAVDNFGFFLSPSTSCIHAGTPVEMPFFLVSFLLKNDHCQRVDSRVLLLKDPLDAEASIVSLRDTFFFSIESQFEYSDWVIALFYERMAAHTKLIVKPDFNEEDTRLLSSEERKYIVQSRRWFKMYQDYYYRKCTE